MDSSNFETSDMGVAAALLTVGERLLKTRKNNDGYLVFQFEDSPSINKTYQDFLVNKLKLPAKSLLENFRQMRVLWYQVRNQKGEVR